MKRFFSRGWVKFILVMFIFTAVTSPIVVLFGPFDNLKRTVVGGDYAFASSTVHYLVV